jgi:hypothetical protein
MRGRQRPRRQAERHRRSEETPIRRIHEATLDPSPPGVAIDAQRASGQITARRPAPVTRSESAKVNVCTFVASLLYRIAPSDVPTLLIAALFLAAVATLATYVPARRATQINPIVGIRSE